MADYESKFVSFFVNLVDLIAAVTEVYRKTRNFGSIELDHCFVFLTKGIINAPTCIDLKCILGVLFALLFEKKACWLEWFYDQVYLFGGHVTSWKNEHGEELLFVSSKVHPVTVIYKLYIWATMMNFNNSFDAIVAVYR